MAEFKFSCPQCGQHIQCDLGYAGAQINCPSCQKAIVVPQSPQSAAAPPAAPRAAYEAPPPPPPPSGAAPSLATRQSTAAPSTGKRFAGAPSLTGGPPPRKKSGALKIVVGVTAALVGAAIGFFAVQYFMGHLGRSKATKPNPAAQVATPTANAAMQALGILAKVHSAYTNLTSVTADDTITLSLDLSNLTMTDLNPGQQQPANARNANRRPPGMPRTIALAGDFSIKRAPTNWFYFAGDMAVKADRQVNMTNTFAIWSADKGMFMFQDPHQRGATATYMQLPTANPANNTQEQVKNMQHLFDDPANLAKIIKDLGQTEDEPVNGQDCYTLTAKVLGQKVKLWVDKSTYLIPQWQITLGGAISDADIDDAFSLAALGMTNMPPGQLEMAKPIVKQYTPAITKIRGTITSTTKNLQMNPTLTADDFNYPVPKGVRLIRQPGAAPANATATGSTLEARQRNACINNLRQIDGAKNQWALEKGKKNGDAVTEADLTPYLQGKALPKCPAGGKYTLGKVGELPTCSFNGHVLP